MKHTMIRSRVVANLLMCFAAVGWLIACDPFPWETRATAQGDGFCLSVRDHMTGALNPSEAEIRVHDNCDDPACGTVLVELIGNYCDGRTSILDQNIIATTMFWNDSDWDKSCFLIHRSHLLSSPFCLDGRYNAKPLEDTLLAKDSLAYLRFAIHRVGKRGEVTRLLLTWRGTKEDKIGVNQRGIVDGHNNLYFLGVREFSCQIIGDNRLVARMKWGESTDSTTLEMVVPETASGFITFSVEPTP